MDYQGNSKKDKEEKDKPAKEIKKVTTGEVLIQKKTLGQKFKDVFVAVDLKSVASYVVYDICIPAFQNMLVDGVSRGIERMTFGERGRNRYRPGPQTQYNRPINRGFTYSPYGQTQDNLDRRGLTSPAARPTLGRAQLNTDLVLATKEEADLVLEQMTNAIDQYQVVTVGDLNDLVGLPSTHVDQKWGWEDLRAARVMQVREGYLLDLPQPQPLQ